MNIVQFSVLLLIGGSCCCTTLDLTGLVGECRIKIPLGLGLSKTIKFDFGVEEESPPRTKSFSASYGTTSAATGSVEVPIGVDPRLWTYSSQPSRKRIPDPKGQLIHAPWTTPAPVIRFGSSAVPMSSCSFDPSRKFQIHHSNVTATSTSGGTRVASRQWHNLTDAEVHFCQNCQYNGNIANLKPRNLTYNVVEMECLPLETLANSTRHAIIYHVYTTPYSCRTSSALRLIHATDVAKIHPASPAYLSSWLSSIRFLPSFNNIIAPEFAWLNSVLQRQFKRLRGYSPVTTATG